MTILGPLYDSYSSPGYNKISLGNGYYEHAVWKGQGDETLTLFYMTSATNAELNSLASGKVKFQGTSLNPTTNFYTAGSQTIDGETWQIRYREIDDAGRSNNVEATSNSESFFDFSSIDKPVLYGGKRDLTNKVMLLPYLPIKSVVVMFQRLLYSLQLIQIMLMRAQTLSLE